MFIRFFLLSLPLFATVLWTGGRHGPQARPGLPLFIPERSFGTPSAWDEKPFVAQILERLSFPLLPPPPNFWLLPSGCSAFPLSSLFRSSCSSQVSPLIVFALGPPSR